MDNNSLAAAYSPAFFNELIGGKLSLSQKIKVKQISMVFVGRRTQGDKKTTIEEEEDGKVKLDLLLVVYVF